MANKSYLTILLAFLGFLGLSAEIKWMEVDHNFGAFNEDDGNVTCTFKMINLGPEPVAITAARATCGCTTPKYSRSTIMPGDTADISVSYNPTGRPGNFEKKVYVDLSDSDIPRQSLSIRGTVIGSANTLSKRFPADAGKLKFSNSSIAFGDIYKGKGKNVFLKAYNASEKEIKPEWINVPKYLRITTNNPVIKPGEQITYVFTANASESPLYGFVNDTVKMVPSPGENPIDFYVMSMMLDDFSDMPVDKRLKAPLIQTSSESIDFGAYDSEAGPLKATIEITNKGDNPLLVRRAYSVDDGVRVAVSKKTIKKDKKGEISVTFDPSASKKDVLNGRLVIITNDPTGPVTVIRLVGYSKK